MWPEFSNHIIINSFSSCGILEQIDLHWALKEMLQTNTVVNDFIDDLNEADNIDGFEDTNDWFDDSCYLYQGNNGDTINAAMNDFLTSNLSGIITSAANAQDDVSTDAVTVQDDVSTVSATIQYDVSTDDVTIQYDVSNGALQNELNDYIPSDQPVMNDGLFVSITAFLYLFLLNSMHWI